MRKILFILALLAAIGTEVAVAQFTPGQVLGAAALNAALAAPTITGGSINGAPVGNSSASTGAFTAVNMSAGTVGLPSLYWGGDTGSGWYRIGTNHLGLSISNAKVLDVSSLGLGITGSLSATTVYATSVTLGSGSPLSTYVQGSYLSTLTGVTPAATGTSYYTIHGNVVTLDLPALTSVSNATSKTITGMPAALLPSTGKKVLVAVVNNAGASTISKCDLATSGIFTCYQTLGATATAWTSSGVSSVDAVSMSYTRN